MEVLSGQLSAIETSKREPLASPSLTCPHMLTQSMALKCRGQASVDEEADDTGVAPVKARRARAPSKSKFVALVPATDEYIESLHLLFAPPPTTASLPDLHKAQASAAPADPLVTVGLPPKRGRGRCVWVA